MPSHLHERSPTPQNPLILLATVCEDVNTDDIPAPLASPEPHTSSLPPTEPRSEPLIPSAASSPAKKSTTSPTKRHTYGTRSAASRVPPQSPPPSSKASNEHKRPARSHLQAKADLRTKRDTFARRAAQMATIMNSPVNEAQYALLRLIYNQVTPYPSEPFMNILAVSLRRNFKQIKNWFSNERQKLKVDPSDLVVSATEMGESLRLRKVAACVPEPLTDELFEDVVLIHYFKIVRTLHWEKNLSAPDET